MSSESDSISQPEWNNAEPNQAHNYFLQSKAALNIPNLQTVPFETTQPSKPNNEFFLNTNNANTNTSLYKTSDPTPFEQKIYDVNTEKNPITDPYDENLPIPFRMQAVPTRAINGKTTIPLWWWLGAHGGAGVTSLVQASVAANFPYGADAMRAWPNPQYEPSKSVVVVCRSSATGLIAAQNASRQIMENKKPNAIEVMGLVIMADSNREPKALGNLRRMVSMTYSQVWNIPWIEEWRYVGRDDKIPVHPSLIDLFNQLYNSNYQTYMPV